MELKYLVSVNTAKKIQSFMLRLWHRYKYKLRINIVVFYLIETIIVDKGVEKITSHYTAFRDDEYAKKYFTNFEAYYKECRTYLKSNRIRKPMWRKVSYIPRKASPYGTHSTEKTED